MMEHERQKLYGWDKFLYNMYMILTFPVRRWWIILSVLATVLLVLIIIPTLDGVKKEDIIDWYKAKLVHSDLNRAKNKTIAMISKRVDELKDDVKEILPGSSSTNQAAAPKKKESNLVAWNVAEFKKAKYVPNTSATQRVQDANTYALIKKQIKQEAKKKTEIIDKPKKNKADETVIENNAAIPVAYEVRTDLNLEYLDEPETISGTATISGANELYIDETFVYLYGIYTNPRKYNVAEVKKFLEDISKDQTVECDIVAYSTQNQAKTALCFINGVFLNKQMVIENMADNVALKME